MLGGPQCWEQPREVFVLAKRGEAHETPCSFLIILVIYIQVLKVKFLKDVCLILLISLKSNVGRKRNGQCVPDSLFIKRELKASSEERMSGETHQLE